MYTNNWALVVNHSTREVYNKTPRAGCVFANNHDSSVGGLWSSYLVNEKVRDVIKRIWWDLEFGSDESETIEIPMSH